MALISQAVSEQKMFDNNGYIHVYSPGTGAETPPGVKFFFTFSIIHAIVSFAASFPPLNDFVTVFPIQTYM